MVITQSSIQEQESQIFRTSFEASCVGAPSLKSKTPECLRLPNSSPHLLYPKVAHDSLNIANSYRPLERVTRKVTSCQEEQRGPQALSQQHCAFAGLGRAWIRIPGCRSQNGNIHMYVYVCLYIYIQVCIHVSINTCKLSTRCTGTPCSEPSSLAAIDQRPSTSRYSSFQKVGTWTLGAN